MSKRYFIASGILAVALVVPPISAKHAWVYNGLQLHWARMANPVSPRIEYDLNAFNWSSYLEPARSGWNGSSVVADPDVTEFASSFAVDIDNATCPGSAGTVRVCNAAYVSTGWLGLAEVEFEATSGHIMFGIIKLNDTYFDTSTYNTPDWRATVMCQEIGHTLGLSHQNTRMFDRDLKDSYGRETCMDYTARPAGNGAPNAHDYATLATIYNHVDSTTSFAAPAAAAGEATPTTPGNWGRAIAFDEAGRAIVYLRDSAPGRKRVTFILPLPVKPS